jgi:hypothetical protein
LLCFGRRGNGKPVYPEEWWLHAEEALSEVSDAVLPILETEDARCEELSSKSRKSIAELSRLNGSMIQSDSIEPEAMAF